MNYIDLIIFIPEQNKYIQLLSNRLNIKIKYYYVNKHNNYINHFLSHLEIIYYSYFNNYNHILIIDDNIIDITSNNYKILINIITYLQNHKECQYLQLCYTISPLNIFNYITAHRCNNNILKFIGNNSNAYILNKNAIHKIVYSNWQFNIKYMNLDNYYKKLFKNNGYCSNIILFKQNFINIFSIISLLKYYDNIIIIIIFIYVLGYIKI